MHLPGSTMWDPLLKVSRYSNDKEPWSLWNPNGHYRLHRSSHALTMHIPSIPIYYPLPPQTNACENPAGYVKCFKAQGINTEMKHF